MQRFRGGLVFKAHRLLYHSTLGATQSGESIMADFDRDGNTRLDAREMRLWEGAR